MEGETSGLKQNLQAMGNAVKADDDALGDFREVSGSTGLSRVVNDRVFRGLQTVTCRVAFRFRASEVTHLALEQRSDKLYFI